jgi:hypothetical protein
MTEMLRNGMNRIQLSVIAGASPDVIAACYTHLTNDDAYEAMLQVLTKDGNSVALGLVESGSGPAWDREDAQDALASVSEAPDQGPSGGGYGVRANGLPSGQAG